MAAGKANDGPYTGQPLHTEPALRDTVDVQANSYLVLRFVANNPGLHIFHCHIDWHLVRTCQ